MCITDRLAQRGTVFVTDFIRSTYGFLTSTHVDKLRTFRNEVENNYPGCSIITTPWQTEQDKKQRGCTDSENEDDTLPAKKRTRMVPDSTSEKEA